MGGLPTPGMSGKVTLPMPMKLATGVTGLRWGTADVVEPAAVGGNIVLDVPQVDEGAHAFSGCFHDNLASFLKGLLIPKGVKGGPGRTASTVPSMAILGGVFEVGLDHLGPQCLKGVGRVMDVRGV